MSEGEDHILSHLAYKKLYNKRSLAMAPHSSTLAWKIPWMEEPGRLQSIRSLRVRHDWVTSLSLSCIGGGNGNPLQYSCLENGRRKWKCSSCHGRRSLVGCSPWGRQESNTTERLHFHFSLSCIGGGNGNPLQCSCLENPRDGGAWWAAVYGVAQSWTRLKRLSSSSSHFIGQSLSDEVRF